MKKVKSKGVILIMTLTMAIAAIIPVYADDDNIPYEFDLKTGYVNAYTTARYRQTTNIYNHWKVDMRYHSRGDNAQATYWLAKSTGKTKVSDPITTTPKVGAVHRSAYEAANQSNVCLGAENFKNETAHVTGYWDEETK